MYRSIPLLSAHVENVGYSQFTLKTSSSSFMIYVIKKSLSLSLSLSPPFLNMSLNMSSPWLTVIGGGVVGLSVALNLAKIGKEVRSCPAATSFYHSSSHRTFLFSHRASPTVHRFCSVTTLISHHPPLSPPSSLTTLISHHPHLSPPTSLTHLIFQSPPPSSLTLSTFLQSFLLDQSPIACYGINQLQYSSRVHALFFSPHLL